MLRAEGGSQARELMFKLSDAISDCRGGFLVEPDASVEPRSSPVSQQTSGPYTSLHLDLTIRTS